MRKGGEGIYEEGREGERGEEREGGREGRRERRERGEGGGVNNLAATTYQLMKSMVMALSCFALCRSARTRVSAAFSAFRLLQSASSHMNLSCTV